MTALLPAHAQGGEWVVLKSNAARFTPGQILTQDREINLGEGKAITLMGQDGEALQLVGPISRKLTDKGNASVEGENILTRLSGLLRDGDKKKEGTLGATRGTKPAPGMVGGSPESPWYLDVRQGGTYCLRDLPVQLWRADRRKAQTVTIKNIKTGERKKLKWKAGRNKLAWKVASLTEDAGPYLLRIANGPAPKKILLRHFKVDYPTPGHLALGLIRAGCAYQALTLINQL